MNILFICHNTPYPPNKGEKIRAFHIIRHFSRNHRVFLLSLAKDPNDKQYEEALGEFCESAQIFPLGSISKKIFALASLLSSFPITFGYFFSPKLKKSLKEILKKEKIDLVFAFCSSSAQYILNIDGPIRIVDLIDVDSAKWEEYSEINGLPKSLIYRLEHSRLELWEDKIAKTVDLSVVTTEVEKDKLEQISPKSSEKIDVVRLGIDASRYRDKENVIGPPTLLFVGQMDYLPNIDAVVFFSLHILPIIRERIPNVEFLIVGRNPSPVLHETCQGATITGEVEDIRQYLERASVFVAPLRIAFGAQNKVLEAMASGVPVVATSKIQRSLNAKSETEIEVADFPQEFAEKVIALLEDEQRREKIARNARRFVETEYNWENILEGLEKKVLALAALKDLD